MERRNFIRSAGWAVLAGASAVLAPTAFELGGPFDLSQSAPKKRTTKHVVGLRHPVEVDLPEGFLFYDLAGQTMFPLYGPSGGLTVTAVCYLFRSKSEMSRWKGHEFELPKDGSAVIMHEANGDRWAVIQFTKLAEDIHEGNRKSYETFVRLRIESVVNDLTSAT